MRSCPVTEERPVAPGRGGRRQPAAAARREPEPPGAGSADPLQIVTRRDFGRALTRIRHGARQSVRMLARAVDVPPSTLGGYFAGQHLPSLQPPDLLERILRQCGVDEPEALDAWHQAYWRVRNGLDEQPHGGIADASGNMALLPYPVDRMPPVAVSIRPPLGLLDREPSVRGRDRLLNLLDGQLAESTHLHGRPRLHVLHGLGGCGKSTTALALARRAAAAGIRSWWISADSASNVTASMHALALELGASPDRLRLGSLADTLWQLLSDLDEPWLLVFDNADDPSGTLALPTHHVTDGTGWLRPMDAVTGIVVVTTRDGSKATWGEPRPAWLQLHRIRELGPEQGGQVLLELTGDRCGSLTEASTLAARLGGLPLALSLAGRYLAEALDMPVVLSAPGRPRDFVSYGDAVQRGQHDDLFSVGPRTAYRDRLARRTLEWTWELSLDQLNDRGLALARPLLQILACLGPAPIPYEMLLRADLLSASPLFGGSREATGRAVWEALQGLEGLGLVGLALHDGVRLLTLHPLVRDVARRHPEVRQGIGGYLDLMTSLLAPVVEDTDPKAPDAWERWHLLVAHCGAPLDLVNEHKVVPTAVPTAVVELAGRAASYLRAAGHLGQAQAAYENALLASAQRMFPLSHPLVLWLRHDFARVRHDQGDLAGAERMFGAVLAARIATLGPEHPDTLTTQHYLARAWRDQGRLDEADRLFTATLKARLSVLGDDDPNTLTSSNGVADMLRVRGRLGEARDAYKQVLARRTAVLGARHPATLVTRHYLAEVLCETDGLDTSLAELNWLIAANSEVRGKEHPRTLAVHQSLVRVLHDLGQLREAEARCRPLVETRDRLLGATHPATLASRHRLGLILLDLGEFSEAEHHLRAVLVGRLQVFGDRHPNTVLSRETLEAVRRRAYE
ncbi:tetratricopeptide repeat protein [Micromonospora sp. NPDC047793]|uniref:tetratricopeptide repeat protein n=1 Tax=Micromonospora sp. NPDC047793 TaxID=3154342 RepID=UPI0033C3BD3C